MSGNQAPRRRQPTRRQRLVRTAVAATTILVVLLVLVIGHSGSGGGHPGTAAPTAAHHAGHAKGTTVAQPAVYRSLSPATGPGNLAPGSDPSVLPGPILIADKKNNRLLIVDPQGRIRWQFPRPGDLAPGQTFLIPDDAFFTPNGKDIIATEEDNFVISVIDIATHRIIYRYGHPGTPGSAPGYLDNPDDAMMLRNGDIIAADIKNCRLLALPPGGTAPMHVYGETTQACLHDPPNRFGSPNGMFPLANGDYLVTEINGDWVNEMTPGGAIRWSTHPPGVAYPSDSNQVGPDRYLTVDYSTPGQIVEFNSAGTALWRYRPTSGPGELSNPSLALPLPNGDVLLNDDYNDRVIVVDPHTNTIVWQYGHDGVAGTAPGYLDNPDGVDLLPPYSLLGTHAATMGLPPAAG